MALEIRPVNLNFINMYGIVLAINTILFCIHGSRKICGTIVMSELYYFQINRHCIKLNFIQFSLVI